MIKESERAAALACIAHHATAELSGAIGGMFDEGLNHDAWTAWTTAKCIESKVFKAAVEPEQELVRAIEHIKMAVYCLDAVKYAMTGLTGNGGMDGAVGLVKEASEAKGLIESLGGSLIAALKNAEEGVKA